MKKKLPYFLISFIFLIFWLFYLIVSLSIPISGDGGLHASTVKVMANTGQLIDVHPYMIQDGSKLLPIFYPKLFYSLMTALYVFLGDIVFKIFVPTLGVLTALFIFLTVRLLFKNSFVAFAATIVSLSSNGLITNSVDMFRMETMVMFLNIASIFSLLKFTQKKSISWFLISAIFCAAALGTKQISYVILPIYFLIIFTKLKSNYLQKLVYTIIFYSVSFLIAAPILINEFIAAGTLFYPGVPFVGSIEQHFAKLFHIQINSIGEGWRQYATLSDRATGLGLKFSDPINHLKFLNPFAGNSDNYLSFSNIFIIAGSLYLLYKKQYFLPLFLFLEEFLFFLFPLERYFLMNQIFASMIIGISLGALKEFGTLGFKYISIFVLSIIITASITSAALNLSSSIEIPNYSYGRYIPENMNRMIDASIWIRDNSPLDSVIITPRTSDVFFYAQRKSLWLNQIGGKDIYEAFLNNKIEDIHKISKKYSHSYLLIPKFWVVDNANGTWISFIPRRSIDLIKENKNLFKQVYSNQYIDVFQTI